MNEFEFGILAIVTIFLFSLLWALIRSFDTFSDSIIKVSNSLGIMVELKEGEKPSPVIHARALYNHFRWSSPPDEEGMMLMEAVIRRLGSPRRRKVRKLKEEHSKNG